MPPTTRKKTTLQRIKAEMPKTSVPDSVLLALPPELQKTIMDYITKPSDLRNLCLVNKYIHDLTLPYLYRNMVISLFRLNGKLRLLQDGDHPGLSHVKKLRIGMHCSHVFQSSTHLQHLCTLLKALPKDGLHVFELPTTNPVHQDLAFLLRLSQRRLVNYQQHSLRSQLTDLTPTGDELANVTSLQLFIGKKRDCTPASLLIRRIPALKSLSIQLRTPSLDGLGNSESETGLKVIKALINPAKSATLLGLKQLSITSMCFTSCAPVLPTVLSFDKLQRLQLIRCYHTNLLYEHLWEIGIPLHTLHDELPHNEHVGDAASVFLSAISPLKELRVSCPHGAYGGYQEFGWSDLMPHAPTLQCLELDDWEPGIITYNTGTRDMPGFQTFCNSAKLLQQLAIMSAEPDMIRESSQNDFDAFLTCLKSLQDLRVLKLVLYPQVLLTFDEDEEGCEHAEDARDSHLLRQINRLADKVFNTLASTCPHLVALAMHARDDDGRTQTFAYLRSKQIDLFGNVTHVGVSTEEGRVSYIEPCSSVLERVNVCVEMD